MRKKNKQGTVKASCGSRCMLSQEYVAKKNDSIVRLVGKDLTNNTICYEIKN